MSNLRFNADVEAFSKALGVSIHDALQNIATAVHGKLGEVTPYLTGRARASWNFVPGYIADTDPAPEPPFQVANPLSPTPEELRALNAFYDRIYDRKHATQLPASATAATISNNVHYIDFLNAGGSKQAPALFFEATVAQMENIVNREIARLNKG
jgi:hypothetical protein